MRVLDCDLGDMQPVVCRAGKEEREEPDGNYGNNNNNTHTHAQTHTPRNG